MFGLVAVGAALFRYPNGSLWSLGSNVGDLRFCLEKTVVVYCCHKLLTSLKDFRFFCTNKGSCKSIFYLLSFLGYVSCLIDWIFGRYISSTALTERRGSLIVDLSVFEMLRPLFERVAVLGSWAPPLVLAAPCLLPLYLDLKYFDILIFGTWTCISTVF